MEPRLAKEEYLLLKLLGRALDQEPRPLRLPRETDRNRLFSLAEKHAVTALLFDSVDAETEPAFFPAIDQAAKRTVQNYYRLFFETKYLLTLLREARIEAVVLKGPGAAQFYPVPEYRKSGDIDLLLFSEEDMERAETVFLSHGIKKEALQTENHQIVYTLKDGVEVELHRSFMEDSDDADFNRKLRELVQESRSQIRHERILQNELPVLSFPYQAFSLLLHMLHHYLHAGFGLRLLCDWVACWRAPHTKEDREIFCALIDDCRLRSFTEFVTAVCVQELNLPADALFYTHREDESYRYFLADIFESGEFGDHDSARMVLLRGTRPVDYLREFHHQMKLHFPKASRVAVCWPVLHCITLARFLKNNRTIRNTTTREILKSSKERSRYTEKMELFQR